MLTTAMVALLGRMDKDAKIVGIDLSTMHNCIEAWVNDWVEISQRLAQVNHSLISCLHLHGAYY